MRAGRRAHPQRGFTLIAVLAALAFLALATNGVMSVLSQQAQREREDELLRVGEEFVRAIGAYYNASPGAIKVFPRELEDLVEDRRYFTMKRHIRRVYEDPVGGGSWQVLRRADGRIEGIASMSDAERIRTGAIESDTIQLPASSRYSDWKFVYTPPPDPAQ